MDVLEEDDERLLACVVLEELARAPEDLVEREILAAETDRRCNALDDIVGLGACRLRELRQRHIRGVLVVDSRGAAHDLDEWPERDAASVRQAAAAEQPRLRGRGRPAELLDQAGLADPRLGDDRDPAAAAIPRCGSELVRE